MHTDANIEMKYIIAALYSNYSTTILRLDNPIMRQSDAYTAPPESDKYVVQLEKSDYWP
jgi:hypothetical protein